MKHTQKVRLFFILFFCFLFGQFLFLNRYQREPYPAILLPGGGPPTEYTDTLHYTRHEFKVFTQKDTVLIPAFEVFDKLPRQYVETTSYFLDATPRHLLERREIINRQLELGFVNFEINLAFQKDSTDFRIFKTWLKKKLKGKLGVNPEKISLCRMRYNYVMETKQTHQEELPNSLEIVNTNNL